MLKIEFTKIPDFLTMIAVCITIILIFDVKSAIDNVYLLPLFYAISMQIVKRCYRTHQGIALILFEIIKVCRYLILPIMIALENKFTGVNISIINNEKAVLLMCYELVCVSLVLRFICPSLQRNNKLSNKSFKTSIFDIVIILFFILFVVPVYKNNLFNFSIEYIDIEYRVEKVSISGILKLFYTIGITTLICCMINYIKNKISNQILGLTISSVLCLSYISCSWSDGMSVSRWGLVTSSISSIIILTFFYPNKKKIINSTFITLIIFFIVIGSFLKTMSFGWSDYTLSDSTSFYFSSQMFDEYFEGVRSVSNGIHVADVSPERGIKGILLDWFNSFPLLMKHIGLNGCKVATDYYRIISTHYDLIMPTISMSYMQFGTIFSPLYSIICIYFAFYCNNKMNKSVDIVQKLFYFIITFWFAIFMAVSPNVIDPHLWAPLLGLLILKIKHMMSKKKPNESIVVC